MRCRCGRPGPRTHLAQARRAAYPHDGTTVAAMATRWGFGRAARFTASYREQFGVLPSRTLHL